MLSSRASLEDKLRGFESGAHDYLTKPFELRELEARIQVLHRRRYRHAPAIMQVGDLVLDFERRSATRQGETLNLSPLGYRQLETLMRNSPHVMRYAEVAHALWGDADHDAARLHTHVSLLRTVIDRPFAQSLILTVNGFGYRIVAPSAKPHSIAMVQANRSRRFALSPV